MVDTRGQALSFEGIAAAILLLSAVGFAIQVTAVTPLSPSTSSQHVENQIQSAGEGTLDSAAQSGALQEAVLFWDPGEAEFHNSGNNSAHYQGQPPSTLSLSDTLNQTFSDRNIAYNIIIHYHTDDGMKEQLLVEQGRTSDHAVSASRLVVLRDDDRLVRANGSAGQPVGSLTTEFYADPVGDLGTESIYNVLRVEVVAWRI